MLDSIFQDSLNGQEFDTWDDVVDSTSDLKDDIIGEAVFTAATFDDADSNSDRRDLAEEYGFACKELEEDEEE